MRAAHALAIPAALAVAAYANALTGALVWDDVLLIEQNRALSSPEAMFEAWSHPFWGPATDSLKTMSGAAYYRPLVHLLLFVLHERFGSAPLPFHVLVVAFHALASVLVAQLALNLFKRADAALVAGALFAVHPIHTESVAWVSGISDVGMTAFGLLALVISTSERRFHVVRMTAVAMALLASMLMKEPGVLVAPLLLLTPEWKRRVPPVAIALTLYAALRVHAMAGVDAPLMHRELGLSGWLFMGVGLLGQAVTALVAPLWLNAFHLFAPMSAGQFVAGLFFGGGLLVFAIRHRGLRLPTLMLLLALLPGTLVPRLGLNPFAERYLYLPSVGLALLLGASVVYGPRVVLGLTALGVAFGLGATVERNRVWASDLTLFSDIAKTSPQCPILRENLSNALVASGRPGEALALLTAAGPPLSARERMNLGVALAATKRMPEAEATLRDVLRALPAGNATTEGLLLTNLCLVQQNLKRIDEAVDSCARAVQLVPFIAQTRAIQSRALMLAGRRDEARAAAQRGVLIDPANGPSKLMLERLAP